ncbi:MAG: ECF transporter S component [Christensenellaceae bacterium]|nr:ECF transporter S component [Christensenellaceae bacterium]
MAIGEKSRKLAVTGMLAAILIVLGFTPLGFVPVGPAKATTMYLPVIVGAILEGPVVGLALGLVFGLFSLFQAVTAPGLLSPVFIEGWLFVSILPRLCIGPLAWLAYRAVFALFRGKEAPAAAAGAVAGALTNTVLVLGAICLLYGAKFTELMGLEPSAALPAVLGIAGTNGLPEAALSALVVTPIVLAARRAVPFYRRK